MGLKWWQVALYLAVLGAVFGGNVVAFFEGGAQAPWWAWAIVLPIFAWVCISSYRQWRLTRR